MTDKNTYTLQGQAVELEEILDCRERRVQRQTDLVREYGRPLLCFTMNIPGPVKNNRLIQKAFQLGTEEFLLELTRIKAKVLHQEILNEKTGNEAYFVTAMEAPELKKIAGMIEDLTLVGRLYDMDVLEPIAESKGRIHGNDPECENSSDASTKNCSEKPNLQEDPKCENSPFVSIRNSNEKRKYPQEANIYTPGFRKIDREEIGKPARSCMICGAPGKLCSSRRIHPAAELQARTAEILWTSVREHEISRLAELATRALLYEVTVTPKPGLVDRVNSGSHTDMDFYTYLNSCASLSDYFRECVRTGMDTADEQGPATLEKLREVGKAAERHMLAVTGGVNTHKGAIFTMGILLAAAGRLLAREYLHLDSDPDKNVDQQNGSATESHRNPKLISAGDTNEPEPGTRLEKCTEGSLEDPNEPEQKSRDEHGGSEIQGILHECRRMTAGITTADFRGITRENARTVGEKLYAEYGITGIRGQIEAGLPVVVEYGLPMLKKQLADGKTYDEAGAAALLSIMGHMVDTNMIHRSGDPKIALEEQERANKDIDRNKSNQQGPYYSYSNLLAELDQEYIERNLSPGGCADMLAVCWFFWMLEQ